MSKIAYDSVEKRIIATVLDDRSPFGFDNFNELKSEHFDLEITKKAFEWIKNQLDTDDKISLLTLQSAGVLNDNQMEQLIDFKEGMQLKLMSNNDLVDKLKERRKIRDREDLKNKISKMIDEGKSSEEIASVVEVLENSKVWEKPIPIVNHNIPEFDLDFLNIDYFRDMVENVSEFTQTPKLMPLLIGLASLATALAKKAVVQIKTGYQEPLNLFIVVFMGPANRKSSIYQLFIKPIEEKQEQLREEVKVERRHLNKKKNILEEQLSKLEKAAASTTDTNKQRELFEKVYALSDEIEEMEIPTLPKLIASNVTPEQMNILLEENKGRLAILSDEGGIFKILSGQYSRVTNLEGFNKGWDGGNITDDRVGRSSVNVKNAALTLGLAVQPIIFEDLQNKRAFRQEGAIGRMLLGFPKSKIGHRKVGFNAPELDQLVVNNYKRAMHGLLNMQPMQVDNSGEWIPHVIKMTREAKEIFYNFEEDIERRMGPEGDLNNMVDWAGKLKGNLARVAGIFHLASKINPKTGQASQDIWQQKIEPDSMNAAIELGKILIPHAKKVYGLLEIDPEVELAKYVLERILSSGEEKITKRDVYRLVEKKKEIKKVKDLDKILAFLEERYYLKVIKRENNKPGRNPSPLIKLNPEIIKLTSSDNIDNIDKITNKINNVDYVDNVDTIKDLEFDDLREVVI
ncbi:uncharacterized protein DUF3987 [Halanaerobium saccharolyticum]|jgi:hypothetical protein|uniref:Uncharacterized protein DUF3987 n=1 Tax=Halanaerobium saccharolyticum TaxID=43595 RepID=A0A2T5RJC3_9FIRM|nr:YfjI family protein [Halanaerobium saccharolyticum]PTV98627.1 uncharacterized protein DUF3987 [Halanaerobium saccharolyticum]